jgi:hypothetical protein
MNTLSISEKLLIIAHHPDKSRFRIPEMHLKYGLTGALLLELSLEDRLILENNKAVLNDMGTPIDPVLKEFSERIGASVHPRNIRFWIRRFAQKSGRYKWQRLHEMEKKRVVRIEHRKFLGLIPFKKSYLINKKLQYDLIRETKASVLQQGELNNEQLVILGLVKACRMTRMISKERSERRMINDRLNKIMKESPIPAGVDQAIRQVQAAIIGAVAASGAASAAASR